MDEYRTNLGRTQETALQGPLKLKVQIAHHSDLPVTDCVWTESRRYLTKRSGNMQTFILHLIVHVHK